MNQTGRYKRKIYFINQELQGRSIFQSFIILTLGSLLFIGIFSFFSSNTVSIVYDNYHLQLGTTSGLLFKKILSTQWLFIILGGFLISFITLRLTHRVAGPFFRFEKSLDQMMSGNLSDRIVLRQKDEGKNLAEKINQFNSRLSENLVLMEDSNSKIGGSAERLSTELGSGETEEISRLIQEIKRSQQNIETILHAYTTHPQD